MRSVVVMYWAIFTQQWRIHELGLDAVQCCDLAREGASSSRIRNSVGTLNVTSSFLSLIVFETTSTSNKTFRSHHYHNSKLQTNLAETRKRLRSKVWMNRRMATCHRCYRCGVHRIGNNVGGLQFLHLSSRSSCDEDATSILIVFSIIIINSCTIPIVSNSKPLLHYLVAFEQSISVTIEPSTWSLEPSSLHFSWSSHQAPLPASVLPRIQPDSRESLRSPRNLRPRSLQPKTSSHPRLWKESSRQPLRKPMPVNWLFASAGSLVSTTKPRTTKKNTGSTQPFTTLATLDSLVRFTLSWPPWALKSLTFLPTMETTSETE